MIIILLLILGYYHYNKTDFNSRESFSLSFKKFNGYITISFIVSLVLTIFLFICLQLSLHNPLSYLSKKVKEIAEKDTTSISRALTELAHGDLTAAIKFDTTAIKTNVNGKIRELANGLNSIISNLQEASKEFNNATDTLCKRLFYVGADSYLEGRKAADTMVKILNGDCSI